MVRTKIVCFLLFIFMPLLCGGAIPTVGYVHDFYMKACGNSDLEIPGFGQTEIPSKKYLMTVLSAFTPDANPAEVNQDSIVSIGYLKESAALLYNAPQCCLDKYFDISRRECRLCGEWLTTDTTKCLAGGVYNDKGTCKSCPDGWICPAGSHNRVPCGIGYWCADNVRTRCPDGRIQCPLLYHTTEPEQTLCVKNAVLFNL